MAINSNKVRHNGKTVNRCKNKKRHNKQQYQQDPLRQSSALPISQEIYETITLDTVPEDGETYLAWVKLQAETGDAVMFFEESKKVEPEKEQEKLIENEIRTLTKTPLSIKAVQETYTIHKHHFETQMELLVSESSNTKSLPSNFTTWYKFLTSTTPTLSLLSQFDHGLTLRLITYFIKWLSKKMSRNLCMWFWAIFLRLDSILEVRDVGTLRALAKEASKINNILLKDGYDEQKRSEIGLKFEELVNWGGDVVKEDFQEEENDGKKKEEQDNDSESEYHDCLSDFEQENLKDQVFTQSTSNKSQEDDKFDLQLNSTVTCHFILVIISRFYGQRDLYP